MIPSRLWWQIYRQVAREWKFPTRGPAGSEQNKKRERFGNIIYTETERRYRELRRPY